MVITSEELCCIVLLSLPLYMLQSEGDTVGRDLIFSSGGGGKVYCAKVSRQAMPARPSGEGWLEAS